MIVLTNPRTISYGFDYTGVTLRRTMTTPLSGNYHYTYDKENCKAGSDRDNRLKFH